MHKSKEYFKKDILMILRVKKEFWYKSSKMF